MESKNAEKYIKVCQEVSKDVENDIKQFEGKEFNGKNVATLFGYQAAAINALSNILIQVISALPLEFTPIKQD